jgi:hypothetical protein
MAITNRIFTFKDTTFKIKQPMKNDYSLPHLPHRKKAHQPTHTLLPRPETKQFILSFAAAYWSSPRLSRDLYTIEQIMN